MLACPCHLAECTSQYAGKYLATPRVLQPCVRLAVLRQILSPAQGLPAVSHYVIYALCGCIRLCMHAQWSPLNLSSAHSPSLLHFTFLAHHHDLLVLSPTNKLPCGFVVYHGSFSPLLNYNNINNLEWKLVR